MGGEAHGSQRREEVVIITGCSAGGIGHALALRFADIGFTVVATARSLKSLAALEVQPHIDVLTLDVTVESSIRETIESVITKHGRIDILVNNAGINCVAPVAECPMSLLEKTYQTNVFGAVAMIQAVVPHMAARKNGKILNVSSVTAYAPGPWSGGYTSSKSALQALSDALRLELKPFGISVTVVSPGATVSNIGVNAMAVFDGIASLGLKLYKPYEEILRRRVLFSQSPKSTPTDKFAMKVVEAVVSNRAPAYFTYGHLSQIMLIFYHLPVWARDLAWEQICGMKTVAAREKTD